MIIGRDVLVGVDPAVVFLAMCALLLAVIGGMWSVVFWLIRRLGWAR